MMSAGASSRSSLSPFHHDLRMTVPVIRSRLMTAGPSARSSLPFLLRHVSTVTMPVSAVALDGVAVVCQFGDCFRPHRGTHAARLREDLRPQARD